MNLLWWYNLYLSPSFLALVEAERVLLYSSLGEKLVGLSFASQSERKLLLHKKLVY